MNNIFLNIVIAVFVLIGVVGGWWFLIEELNT